MADDSNDLAGQAGLTAGNSPGNLHSLRSDYSADKRRGLMPAQIVAVHPDPNGGPPTADVQPLVHMVDGLGRPTPHGIVYNVAVGRVHSGSGAIVSDPVVGDVYAMVPADRDVSQLKANGWQASAPNTKRRGSLADGVLHHALTGAPTQAVVFKPGGGVKIFDKGGAVIETSADGKTVYVTPAGGGMLYLGGNPASGGTFSAVETVAGPSSVVQAKL